MTASTRDLAAAAERLPGEPVGPPAGGLGLSLLCAALAVQAALGTMLLAGPPERNPARLSQWGRFIFYPEQEVAVYLAALGLALLGIGLLARRRPGAGSLAVEVLHSATAAALVGVWLVLFVRARTYAAGQEPVPEPLVAGLAALGLLTAGAVAAGRRLHIPDRWAPARIPGGGSQSAAPPGSRAWDLLVPAVILLTVYVSPYRQAAGRIFLEESLLHWDHFAMGPALLFQHGQALGTEALSYYGAGWPMVFSALDPLIPISFGHMIQVGSAYLCLYLAGVYLLLRLLTGRPGVAAAGTALAAGTLFYWMEGLYLWRAPNVTPLRWAFDVWCLIALVLHHRSGRPAWAGAAGAAVGLAVVFNFNAGIELAAATLFYWFCLARVPHSGPVARSGGLFAGAAAGVALAGMALAGRGQVFSGAFWRGWMSEPLSFLTLPLATGTRTSVLVAFVVLVFTHLGVCGFALAAAVQRRATQLTVLSGTIALYGLLLQVKFLRHSSEMTFPRLLMPAAILLTLLLPRLVFRGGVNTGRWRHAVVPAVVAMLIGLVLLAPGSPVVDPVLDYPNLLSSAVRGVEPEGVCLMNEPRDLCGLPEVMSGSSQEFQDLSARLATLTEQARSVGVVDETGSLFYLASGTPPFGRYTRIFTTAYTTELLEQAVEPFQAHPPDYLLTRVAIPADSPELGRWAGFGVGPRPDSPYADAWEALGSVVREHYVLDATVGPFELWRLAGLPAEP
jgi:hypothetical protein